MFKNLFRPRTPMSPADYQRHVVRLLHDYLPDEPFKPTDNPLVIRLGEIQCGLQNLYSSYLQGSPSRRARDHSIREHFLRLSEGKRLQKELQEKPWEEIQPLLRPQFIPCGFPDPAACVAYPFSDDLLIGLVIDSPGSYQYVRLEDKDRWGQPPSALYDAAIDNLGAVTREVELHLSDEPDRWATIDVSDGYAAARLLLPDIRRKAVSHLGSPCFAVIPNRDFLFFWATDNSPHFDAAVRSQAISNHTALPYPLTNKVFAATVQEVTPCANP